MVHRLILVVALVSVVMVPVMTAPRVASACSFEGNGEHFIDSELDDEVAPEAIGEVVPFLSRGSRTESGDTGCETAATSCDDIGAFTLTFEAPSDNLSQPENIGYVIELVDGSLPSGVTLPAEPVRRNSSGELFFAFKDDSTDLKALNFSLRLTPIDEAGNLGPSTDPIRFSDPGDTGCNVAGAPSVGSALTYGLLALLILAARRRSSHPSLAS